MWVSKNSYDSIRVIVRTVIFDLFIMWRHLNGIGVPAPKQQRVLVEEKLERGT